MEFINEIIAPLGGFVFVAFAATEVVKQVLRRIVGIDPKKWTILIAIVFGLTEAYVWMLPILPEPAYDWGIYVNFGLTGLLIAGAASGLFSWLKELWPWFAAITKAVE